MSERPTVSLETPNGHKVEVYEYLSGGESRQIQRVLAGGLSIDIGNENVGSSDMDGSLLMDAQDKLLELLVVSLDGEKDKAFEHLMDLRIEDVDYVLAEVNKLTSTEKKTKN